MIDIPERSEEADRGETVKRERGGPERGINAAGEGLWDGVRFYKAAAYALDFFG